MAKKILVAEDQPQLREWLVAHLRAAGYNAAGVGDGTGALKVLLCESPPDLLLLDLHMPGMNGIDVLKHLRASPAGKSMPVIVITGVYKGEDYAAKARQYFGVEVYIEKPFEIEMLLGHINAAFGREHAAESPPTEKAPLEEEKHMFEGDISTTPFDKLLLRIWKAGLTGLLIIESIEEDNETAERRFAFLTGRPVLGRSNAPNEDFGAHLISRGKATPEENREYQKLKASGRRDPEEIFVSMGCLSPDGLTVERVRHLEEMLIGGFALTEGYFVFDQSDLEVGAVAGASIPRAVHEGYRRHMSENELGALFTELAGKYFCRTAAFYDHIHSLELDEDEDEFVDTIGGCSMLKDLAGSGDFHKVLKAAATLIALGMVKASDTPVSDQVEAPYPTRPKEERIGTVCDEEIASAPAGDAGIFEMEDNIEGAGAFEDLGSMLSDELGDIANELGDMDLDIPDNRDRINETHKKLEEELRRESERLKNGNYYEFFHTKPAKFKFDEVKKKYFELRKIFSPENYIEWASGEVISVAEEVLALLNTAYNTLSNVVSKEKYDELIESSLPKVTGDKKEDRFQAQVQFESGKAFVEMNEFASAEQALREAIDLNPNVAEYHAWLAWAVYSDDPDAPSGTSAAKKEIAQALKFDSRCAIAFAFKGAMILDEGNLDMAEVELRRALKYNPRSGFAKRKMRELQTLRENEKKGLLGRIFS